MNISLWEANINVCNIEMLEGPSVNGGKNVSKAMVNLHLPFVVLRKPLIFIIMLHCRFARGR